MNAIQIGLWFAVALAAPPVVSLDDETPPFAEPARALFEAAKSQFDKEQWADAEKSFKECKKATDKAGAKYLEPWIKACKGGKKLGKLVAGKNARKSLGQLAKMKRTYDKTPLASALAQAYAKVHQKIYFALSTFEVDKPEPESRADSIPPGARYETNKQFVKEGKRSLKWASRPNWGDTPSIPLGDFPGGMLDKHRFLSFWIYSPDDVLGKYLVVFRIGAIDVLDSDGDPEQNCFFRYVNVTKKGWQHVRVDLDKDLSKYGNAKRERVRGLHLLMLPFSKTKTIYVDDVMLEKR